jgi:hypothetical protein
MRPTYSLPMLASAGAVAYVLLSGIGPTLHGLLRPSTTIDQLLSEPSRYDGKIVKVDGMVVGSFGLMGLGGFRLQDLGSRREILVMTSGGVPLTGAPTLVWGKYKQAVSIGSYQYAVIFQTF